MDRQPHSTEKGTGAERLNHLSAVTQESTLIEHLLCARPPAGSDAVKANRVHSLHSQGCTLFPRSVPPAGDKGMSTQGCSDGPSGGLGALKMVARVASANSLWLERAKICSPFCLHVAACCSDLPAIGVVTGAGRDPKWDPL